jgi:hypothetical protein
MTPAEVAEVLAMVAAFDRRTVGRADVAAWHLVLGDLEASDVREAVAEHFSGRRDWLMPADIRDSVKAKRAKRLSLVVEQVPDADPDDVPAYLDALREQRFRVADGTERQRDVAALVAQVERATVIE